MFECKGPINIPAEKNKIPHKTLEEIAFEIFFEERRWLHANPTIYTSKEYKELMKNYIIETNDLKKSSKNFFNEIVNGDKKYIFLAGKRGVGKTTFLNYFLNTRTKNNNCENEDIETLNDKNLTWIRIDATKIYRQVFAKSMTFEKYLYGQILYVYFRYKDECEIIKVNEKNNLKVILNCCKPDKIFKEVNLADIIKDTYKDEPVLRADLLKYIEEVEKVCKSQPNFEDGFNNKPDGDCNSSIREEKYNCILAKLLLENLKDKLILFIDGVDNLNYSTFLRENSIDDLLNLIRIIRNNNKYFKKIIISARYDTVYQIKKHISSENYGEENTFLFELNIGLDYIEYFKNRIEQIQNYQCNDLEEKELDKKIKKFIENIGIEIKKTGEGEDFYYKNECYNKIKKNNNIETVICFLNKKHQLLKDFKEYLKFYNNVINKEFKIGIKELFNDDFREIIVNVTKCFFYLRMDYHKRLAKKNLKFEEYLNESRTGNVLKNAIIKNGSLYGVNFDEISYIPPYRNIAFTNMFNIFGIKNAGINYEYIIYFLVLKIMYDKKINSISKLQDVFKKYDKYTIEEIVAKFMEYGYIDCKKDEIVLSEKGKFFVEKFFSNMFFLHSNIYNGLLREEFIDFISPHKPDFSDYISKTIENVSVLLYDLYLQLKDIKIYIDEEEKKIYFNNVIRNSELISHFKGLIKQRDNYTFNTIFENLKKTYNKNKGSNDCSEKCNKIIKNIKNFLIITLYGDITFDDIKKDYNDLEPAKKIKLLIDLLPLSYEDIKDSIKYMTFIYGEEFNKKIKQFENDFQNAQKINIASFFRKKINNN